jgi:hypothetical protein
MTKKEMMAVAELAQHADLGHEAGYILGGLLKRSLKAHTKKGRTLRYL